MILDITTTATNRIDIIERTFASFTNKIQDVDWDKCTLYINIDPIPKPKDNDIIDIIHMCKRYFGTIVHRHPSNPSISNAYNWLWSKAKSEYILNLEDDWILNQKISIYELKHFFEIHHNLYSVILRAYPWKYDSVSLSPSLLHERFYKKVAGKFNPDINAEVQLRAHRIPGLVLPNMRPENGQLIENRGVFVLYPKSNGVKNVIVKDIGRDWIQNTNYTKPNTKEQFNTWIEK